jgi:hypothetical protein
MPQPCLTYFPGVCRSEQKIRFSRTLSMTYERLTFMKLRMEEGRRVHLPTWSLRKIALSTCKYGPVLLTCHSLPNFKSARRPGSRLQVDSTWAPMNVAVYGKYRLRRYVVRSMMLWNMNGTNLLSKPPVEPASRKIPWGVRQCGCWRDIIVGG